MMRRSDEVERLEKEKEIWNKEDRLSKEEYVASWTFTIETLERIYKGFYSYKDYRLGKFNPEPVWTSVVNYKDEDKVACKNEVIKILKLCKKEYVLINNPAVVHLIYVNRLNKTKFKSKAEDKELTVYEESQKKMTTLIKKD
jgi:hypothetical protein